MSVGRIGTPSSDGSSRELRLRGAAGTGTPAMPETVKRQLNAVPQYNAKMVAGIVLKVLGCILLAATVVGIILLTGGIGALPLLGILAAKLGLGSLIYIGAAGLLCAGAGALLSSKGRQEEMEKALPDSIKKRNELANRCDLKPGELFWYQHYWKEKLRDHSTTAEKQLMSTHKVKIPELEAYDIEIAKLETLNSCLPDSATKSKRRSALTLTPSNTPWTVLRADIDVAIRELKAERSALITEQMHL